jgi:hypothetical protein
VPGQVSYVVSLSLYQTASNILNSATADFLDFFTISVLSSNNVTGQYLCNGERRQTSYKSKAVVL